MKWARAALISIVAGLVLGVTSAVGTTTTTIGATGVNLRCTAVVDQLHVAVAGVASYTVPAGTAWTITSWTWRSAPTDPAGTYHVALVILRAATGGSYSTVASASGVGAGGGTINTFTTSIPVQTGDVIALWRHEGAACGGLAGGFSMASINTAQPAAGDVLTPGSTSPSVRPDISATLSRPDVPGAPSNVVASGGDGQARATWDVPGDDGGSPITSYTLTASPGGQACTATSGGVGCTVLGLTNGTTYSLSVTATNVAGAGPASAASNTVTPAGPPRPPLDVSAVAGDTQATVSWSAADPNGNPISGYTVTASPGGATCATTGATSCTVTGLTNGTSYTFTVTATNAVGAGPPSTGSVIVKPLGPPGPVTNVVVVPGDGNATVTWDPPVDDGGDPITEYTVTAGSHECQWTRGPLLCVVVGLTNGTAYKVSVVASNAVGAGHLPRHVPTARPSLAAGLHKTSVRLVAMPRGIVFVALQVAWLPGARLEVARYDVIRANRRVATISRSARHLTIPTFSATGIGRVDGRRYGVIVRAVGPGGRPGPSLVVTLTRVRRPAGLRRRIPHWAWAYVRWQYAPAELRGAMPAHPRLLPRWYATWADWRRHPVRIAG